MSSLQTDIEQRLSGAMPDLDVLLVEQSGPDTLRVFIDHPGGVSLSLCEQVTRELGDLRERWAVEVSSPGPQRPLSKPEHFKRFIGRRVKVSSTGTPRRATGELVGADSEQVTVAAAEGLLSIPYRAIQRSHLVEE